LKFEVNISTISERVIAGEKIIKLKVARKPDKNSTRFGMFVFLRNSQPGYKSLGFSEVTLIFDRHAENGKFLSRTFIVFHKLE